jgi:hypothetical protein
MSRKHNCEYPSGSVSTGTMVTEDLIPTFADELQYRLKHSSTSRGLRKMHYELLTVVREWKKQDIAFRRDEEFLLEQLFDALDCYAGPYFYFGAHPGDGADYGYWLSEGFEDEFDGLKVSDLSEVPAKYRGEVLVINDHGNMSLYVKTSRALREVWSVV